MGIEWLDKSHRSPVIAKKSVANRLRTGRGVSVSRALHVAVLVSDFRRCFTLCLFIILLVQFGLLSGHLLGNSCPLG